jgi:hypothetical protein
MSHPVDFPTVTAMPVIQEVAGITPIAITETATSISAENHGLCAYNWATQPLPNESAEIQELFDQSEMTDYQVRAEAYGENCVAENGSVVSFSALETDIYITVSVKDLQNRNDLGFRIYDMAQVLKQIDLELPGPNVGYLGVTFQQGGQTMQVWVPRDSVNQAISNGVRGSGLLDAFQSHQ